MSFGARQALVKWVLSYDWATDPIGIYNRPQDLAEVWPLVRIYYMMRFGSAAHNLNHLIGFLEFLKKAPSQGRVSEPRPALLNTATPVDENGNKQSKKPMCTEILRRILGTKKLDKKQNL